MFVNPNVKRLWIATSGIVHTQAPLAGSISVTLISNTSKEGEYEGISITGQYLRIKAGMR